MDYAEKMQRCHEYVETLEEEKRKIQVFERELPLCLELVTQAIEACRRELSGTTTEYMHGQSECTEQTSSDGPVLEEFIPIKRSSSDGNNNDDQHSHKPTTTNRNSDKKKSDWLRSVQLWNESPDPQPQEEVPKKATVVEVKRNGGAFQPFHREKSVGKTEQQFGTTKANNALVPTAAASSTTETLSKSGTGNKDKDKDKDKDGQAQRKQRRCWSPELHRRFLHALQQLGGSHAATPKQIRELMKVDGLTNDEVKSHLQKYRLHTRRPSPTMHNNANPQAPQFVVVGGIWVPPPEYAAKAPGEASAATIATNNGLYAPVAAPPPAVPQSSATVQRSQQTQSGHLQSEVRGSHSDDDHHSNSPATSSSTHTTTASPAF